MKATRVYPNEENQLLLRECEYGKGVDGTWMIRPPRCRMGTLAGHEVVEHADGTITAIPSILIDDGVTKWHGYLTRGIWSEC